MICLCCICSGAITAVCPNGDSPRTAPANPGTRLTIDNTKPRGPPAKTTEIPTRSWVSPRAPPGKKSNLPTAVSQPNIIRTRSSIWAKNSRKWPKPASKKFNRHMTNSIPGKMPSQRPAGSDTQEEMGQTNPIRSVPCPISPVGGFTSGRIHNTFFTVSPIRRSSFVRYLNMLHPVLLSRQNFTNFLSAAR